MPESSTGEQTTTVVEDKTATNSDVKETVSDASTGSEQDKGQDTQGSIADAVTAALKSPAKDEDSPASKTQDQTTKAEDPDKAKAEELPEEVTEDELKDQKPKTRKRIEQLLGKVKSVSQERDTLAPKAAEYDKFATFVQNAKLSQEDVQTTFRLAALVRNEPEKALEQLTPIYQQLQQLVGNVLPAELQERVRLGYISETDARELHRSRTSAKLANTRTEETRRETAEREENDRRTKLISDVSSAVSTWETAKKTSDPDWHLKADRIDQLVRLEVYEKGYPQNPKAGVEMIEKIYDTVTKELRKFSPKPQAKDPSKPGGSSASTVAEPKSLLDAVRIGLNSAA